jgi:hypothetical protein
MIEIGGGSLALLVAVSFMIGYGFALIVAEIRNKMP